MPEPVQAKGDSSPLRDGPRVLVLISDLMFLSKVREALKRLEIDAVTISSPSSLDEKGSAAVLLIADVNDSRLQPIEAIRKAKERRIPVLAFGSHVDGATLEAARAAGADEVVPRSVFSARLSELVVSLVGGRP